MFTDKPITLVQLKLNVVNVVQQVTPETLRKVGQHFGSESRPVSTTIGVNYDFGQSNIILYSVEVLSPKIADTKWDDIYAFILCSVTSVQCYMSCHSLRIYMRNCYTISEVLYTCILK